MIARVVRLVVLGTMAASLAAAGVTTTTDAVFATTAERTLSLTKADGSPVGTVFDPVVMVPGGTVSTTVYAHRTGGGASDLTVTLSRGESTGSGAPSVFEQDAVVTVATQGIERSARVADLITGNQVIELGRSAVEALPIDVSITLPFTSDDDSQLQSLDLQLVVTAVDLFRSESPLDALPHTGVSAASAIFAGAVVAGAGLVLFGARRRRDDENAD